MRRPFCRLPMRSISQNFDEGSVLWYLVAISSDRFLVKLAEKFKYSPLYDSVGALLHLSCPVYLFQGFSVQVFSDLSRSYFLFVNV